MSKHIQWSYLKYNLRNCLESKHALGVAPVYNSKVTRRRKWYGESINTAEQLLPSGMLVLLTRLIYDEITMLEQIKLKLYKIHTCKWSLDGFYNWS